MLFSRRGFTLIEVMIVLSILAAVIALGAPKLFKKNSNLKTTVRHFIVLSREIRNKARLNNSTYRLAIRMEPKNEKYWVERASGPIPLDPDAAEKEKERLKSVSKDEKGPPPLFQMDPSLTKKEQELPSGFRFANVETINMKQPQTEGVAYIHFFAEGFVEAAVIQISNGNNSTWTLVFNPLTGQADIVEKAKSLKDIQR
jgi:general secretion pathway protein H